MKRFLIVLLALVPLVALAQPAIITVSDTGPTVSLTCPPANFNGCSSGTFTVPVTGDYAFDVWTKCETTPCANCVCCAVIIPQTDPLTRIPCSVGCPGGPCTRTCTVSLRAGLNYTLQVCLQHCPTGATACNDHCTAVACVRNIFGSGPCYPQ
jgi:hypothetical protein